jgi:hypothetical protein
MPKTETRRDKAYVAQSLGKLYVQTHGRGNQAAGNTTKNARNVVGDSAIASIKGKGSKLASPRQDYPTPNEREKIKEKSEKAAGKLKKTVSKAVKKAVKKVKGK